MALFNQLVILLDVLVFPAEKALDMVGLHELSDMQEISWSLKVFGVNEKMCLVYKKASWSRFNLSSSELEVVIDMARRGEMLFCSLV